MSNSQIPTPAQLKWLFTERGVRPSRVRGQNFLVDPHAMNSVLEAAQLDRRDVILEPGPGTGGLTRLLAERAGAVLAVEVDRKLYEIASGQLRDFSNVRLIHADILDRDGDVAPPILDMVRRALDSAPGSRFKIVSNLPYSVSTAFIAAVLLGDPLPADIVATVQREVADRMCAQPGSNEYGYLSVIVQVTGHARILRRISPRSFWPQPEVESSVIHLQPDPARRARAGDLDKLRRVAGALFGHRRKQLAGSLLMGGLVRDRQGAARVLAAIGSADSGRCEDLSPAQFVRLAELLS